MGALLSSSCKNNRMKEDHVNPQAESCKRQRMVSSFDYEKPRLFPNLPDEISVQILARLPRRYYLTLKLVSRSWKIAVTSSEIFQLRKELGTTEEWLYMLTKVEDDKLMWYALDPSSKFWQRLPLMPTVVDEEGSKKGMSVFRAWNVVGYSIKIADVIRGWLGRKECFNRMPFCGCAVGSVDGCLYVVGGFSRTSAMQCVWRYDPCVNLWVEVNSMTIGRAYCKAGLLNNKLYVVGGVSRGRGGLTPLQSAEVFDPTTGTWTEVPSMPFSRAQILPTAFLADMLKPIATGMTSYKGRLCVPQSLYSWPFFVDLGGEIYDPETNKWVEMPAGMGEGWPARQAGTKLSVVVNEELYALDPSSSLDNGKIKIYDHQEDIWKVVVDEVPICDFTDSEAPYLLAALLGKLHVITKDANSDIVVLQADMRSPSSSLTHPGGFIPANPDSISETKKDVWNIVAIKSFGSAELVSCQVLAI